MQTPIFLTMRRLPFHDKKILLFSGVGFVLLALLDVASTLLLALVSNLALNLNQDTNTIAAGQFPVITNLLKYNTGPNILFCIMLFGVIFLILKSLFNFLLQKRILAILRSRQTRIARNTLTYLGKRQYKSEQDKDRQVIIYSLTDSLSAATLDVMANLIVILSEGVLLATYLIILLRVDLLVTVIIVLTLIPSIWFSIKSINTKSAKYGRENYEYNLKSKQNINDGITLSKELMLLGKENYIVDKYLNNLSRSSYASSKQVLLAQAPKYMIEILTILSILGLSSAILLSQNPKAFASEIIIFFLASGRIFPSFLRLQGSMIAFTVSSAKAQIFNDVANSSDFKNYSSLLGDTLTVDEPQIDQTGRNIRIEINDVTFSYPETHFSLHIPTLVIQGPGLYILSGPSGIGKSTLCNLIIGLQEPEAGTILIDDLCPSLWVRKNPGGIAYATQEDNLIIGTLLENICLGRDADEIDQNLLLESIFLSGLEILIDSLPDKLETQIGEGGDRLSGGQRQRISLARALYSNPKFLILDEPTSSLDHIAEKEIIELIADLSLTRAVLVVSHSRRVLTADGTRIVATKGKGRTLIEQED